MSRSLQTTYRGALTDVQILRIADATKLDPTSLEVTLTQADDGTITVEIDRTVAANTAILGLTLLWPLRDIYGQAAAAGINWVMPPLTIEMVTDPVATSDMRISCGLAEAALTEYNGHGVHFDAAGGPDRFRETSTALTDSTQMLDFKTLHVRMTGSPVSATVIEVVNMDGEYLDSTGTKINYYNQLALKQYDTAPYVYLSFGGSSIGAGTATAVLKFGAMPSVPVTQWGI